MGPTSQSYNQPIRKCRMRRPRATATPNPDSMNWQSSLVKLAGTAQMMMKKYKKISRCSAPGGASVLHLLVARRQPESLSSDMTLWCSLVKLAQTAQMTMKKYKERPKCSVFLKILL
jgi:hypothetical protein